MELSLKLAPAVALALIALVNAYLLASRRRKPSKERLKGAVATSALPR